MKLRKILPALLLVMGMALCTASHAHADYVLWTPTTSNDQNVFSFELTPQQCTMTGDLYIFAPGSSEGINLPGNALLFPVVSFTGTDFTISETGGVWSAYDSYGNFLLTLGATNQFGLYYNETWGTSSAIVQPTITDVSGLYDQWILNTQDGCLPVLLVDAQPAQEGGSITPIPSSILLMASGLGAVIRFLRPFLC